MRCGIFASAHHAAGGGGGTVTVEEYQSFNPASFSSSTIPLSTTLSSTDVVLMVYSRTSSGAGTITIDGGTFVEFGTYLNSTTRVQVSTVTGLTGSHTISYTMTSGTNLISIYVIRGLSDPSITASSQTTWPGPSTPSNTDVTPAAVSVDDGQIVIAVGIATGSGTITFPSSPDPATGWTGDSTGSSRTRLVHQIFTVPDTAQVSVRCTTSGATLAVLMLVLGDPF